MGEIGEFFRFPFLSEEEKTNRLLQYAAQDEFFEPAVQMAKAGNLAISHHWWGAPAHYSGALKTDEKPNPKLPKLETKNLPRLHIATRYGPSVAIHSGLHELVHFQQDMAGMMPEANPALIPADSTVHILEPASDVMRFVLCEGLAAMEAIRASYRLKQQGKALAWNGALYLPVFKKMAQQYQQDLKNSVAEKKAAKRMLQQWYASPLKQGYEKRALKSWKFMCQRLLKAQKQHPFTIQPCNVPLEKWLDCLPTARSPTFLKPLKTSLHEPVALHLSTQRSIEKRKAQSPNIQRASPAKITNHSVNLHPQDTPP